MTTGIARERTQSTNIKKEEKSQQKNHFAAAGIQTHGHLSPEPRALATRPRHPGLVAVVDDVVEAAVAVTVAVVFSCAIVDIVTVAIVVSCCS